MNQNIDDVRLQKYLSQIGFASRRKCEEYILEGKIKINEKVVTKLGIRINPDKDKIFFENKEIQNINNEKIYILLNKPIGYVTTLNDQFNRKTVIELINVKERIVPVGRLDMYTSGALILTNDGEFVNIITHPKHEIEKTYIATVKGTVSNKDIEKLKNGIVIDDYKTKPAKAKILRIDEKNNISKIEIIIHEGKNRQVRKMCKNIDKKVIELHRSKIGDLDIKDLKIGEWRYLKESEIQKCKEQ